MYYLLELSIILSNLEHKIRIYVLYLHPDIPYYLVFNALGQYSEIEVDVFQYTRLKSVFSKLCQLLSQDEIKYSSMISTTYMSFSNVSFRGFLQQRNWSGSQSDFSLSISCSSKRTMFCYENLSHSLSTPQFVFRIS